MSEVRPELHLWQAYCEKKMELEDMEDRVHELEAVIREILSQIVMEDEIRRRVDEAFRLFPEKE
jgi:hypothetical protein